MVGRSGAAVAADEAHCGPPLTLAGEEQEIADDHPEVVEIPIECRDVLGGLQHEVPEPLHLGWHARGPLCPVRPPQLVTEIEGVDRLRRRHREVMCSRHDMDGNAARVDEIHGHTAERFG